MSEESPGKIKTIADLVAFLKRFHRDWLDDPSLDSSLIPADLPPGLALIYRELGALVEVESRANGRRRSPFGTQDYLEPVGQLRRISGKILFAYENQAGWGAFCEAGRVDPPVYSDWDGDEEHEWPGVVVCDSLDHFLTTLCLREAVMSCRHKIHARTRRSARRTLTIPLLPLWLDGKYVGKPLRQFYATPDEDVIVLEEEEGLWIGSPTREVAGLVPPGIPVHRFP